MYPYPTDPEPKRPVMSEEEFMSRRPSYGWGTTIFWWMIVIGGFLTWFGTVVFCHFADWGIPWWLSLPVNLLVMESLMLMTRHCAWRDDMRDWYREGINWKLREAPIRPLPLSPVEKAWLSVGVILAMITLYTTVGLAWHLL